MAIDKCLFIIVVLIVRTSWKRINKFNNSKANRSYNISQITRVMIRSIEQSTGVNRENTLRSKSKNSWDGDGDDTETESSTNNSQRIRSTKIPFAYCHIFIYDAIKMKMMENWRFLFFFFCSPRVRYFLNLDCNGKSQEPIVVVRIRQCKTLSVSTMRIECRTTQNCVRIASKRHAANGYLIRFAHKSIIKICAQNCICI